MREPPDRLTERVLQMLAAAHTSSMSRDEVRARLMLSLRRNLSYLVRKNQRTPYVEALEGDLEAMARAIVLLSSGQQTNHEDSVGDTNDEADQLEC